MNMRMKIYCKGEFFFIIINYRVCVHVHVRVRVAKINISSTTHFLVFLLELEFVLVQIGKPIAKLISKSIGGVCQLKEIIESMNQ